MICDKPARCVGWITFISLNSISPSNIDNFSSRLNIQYELLCDRGCCAKFPCPTVLVTEYDTYTLSVIQL